MRGNNYDGGNSKTEAKKRPLILSEFKLMFPDEIPFLLKTRGYKFTDQELYAIDAANEDLRIESNSNGDLEIILPPFPETS